MRKKSRFMHFIRIDSRCDGGNVNEWGRGEGI